MYRYTYTRISR